MPENKDEVNQEEIFLGKEKAIKLKGFSKLDLAELSVVKKIAGHYTKKIEDILHDYDEIKVRLKMHQRSNLFIHEIESEVFAGNMRFAAKAEHKNLFHALSDCFEAIIIEIAKKFKDKEYIRKEKDKSARYQLGVDIEELKEEKEGE
ncbi:MAG: hypothetical protein QW622_01180 [Candidatus Pacearchaeota archaeon]